MTTLHSVGVIQRGRHDGTVPPPLDDDAPRLVWKKGEQAEIYETIDGACSESSETFKRPDDVFPGYAVVCVTEC